MRTPKFTQADIDFIKSTAEYADSSTKEMAKTLGISLMTMYKIKAGTYKPNTREGAKSGLADTDGARQVSLF